MMVLAIQLKAVLYIGELIKMIEVEITKTAKGYNKNDKYSIYDHETKLFKDMQEVKKWIKETYSHSKKQKMYQDTKDNKSIQTGYVISFRSEQYNNDTGRYDHFVEAHWISFYKKELIVL